MLDLEEFTRALIAFLFARTFLHRNREILQIPPVRYVADFARTARLREQLGMVHTQTLETEQLP